MERSGERWWSWPRSGRLLRATAAMRAARLWPVRRLPYCATAREEFLMLARQLLKEAGEAADPRARALFDQALATCERGDLAEAGRWRWRRIGCVPLGDLPRPHSALPGAALRFPAAVQPLPGDACLMVYSNTRRRGAFAYSPLVSAPGHAISRYPSRLGRCQQIVTDAEWTQPSTTGGTRTQPGALAHHPRWQDLPQR